MGESSIIERRQQRRKRILIATTAFFIALVMVIIFLCGFLDVRSPRDLIIFRAMAKGDFHPLWKDLALRRVHKDDSLAETIGRYPPTSREEVGPFTVLLYDGKALGRHKTQLRIIAANGVLTDAFAACSYGDHVFFQSPSQREAFTRAYSEYVSQQLLESKAYQIHRAITAGQDVFISRRIDRREVADPNESQRDPKTRQLEEIYGKEYAKLMAGTSFELTVEVSEVLSGELKPGTELKFSDTECEEADLAEPETVFLHVEDSRTIRPNSEGGGLYTTVPGNALAWYQSLTPDEIKDFEARCQSRLATPETEN